MKLAIMQPYFFPYVGYFQLLSAVDTFVVYDNIKYTKKGWINRNRFLQNHKDATFSIPIAKDSDYLNVDRRRVSAEFNRTKLLNQIQNAYRKAPYFNTTFPVFEAAVNFTDPNLFLYIKNSLDVVCNHLGICTKMVASSEVTIDHSLQGQNKVIAIGRAMNASMYVNPIGGKELYAATDFCDQGINLCFLESKPLEYEQFGREFVPWLSILDVMMFNSTEKTTEYWANGFTLV